MSEPTKVSIFIDVKGGCRQENAIEQARLAGCQFVNFNNRLIPVTDTDWDNIFCPFVRRYFLIRREQDTRQIEREEYFRSLTLANELDNYPQDVTHLPALSGDICSRCGGQLNFDEVDIGVGTLRGNPGCPEGPWVPSSPDHYS